MIFPTEKEILEARTRIASYIHYTPVLTSQTLNEKFDAEFYFKCENFQKAGAFKSRGAVNAVLSLTETELKRGVATHSSGNHAQALARAAQLKNIPAYIVMPENAPRVKVDAVKAYGGIITFCEPTLKARELTLERIVNQTDAIVIHPYDNLQVIQGQATSAAELIETVSGLDLILCPVGGGGLLSGTALSARYFSPRTKVIACEPSGADDAYLSFYTGKWVPSEHPKTIADGLLTSLGKITYPVIKENVHEIVTVSEDEIIEAMRFLFERMKIVVEPSSAVPLAAVLNKKIDVKRKKVGLILSGGNVDLNQLPFNK
ncbi:MAG: pyridoxal-phosphate dependent enzyme [Bacteroidales bacterium]|nr:pyridoxal-phosphate dependent enzyme [Bacteroidales bacterium]